MDPCSTLFSCTGDSSRFPEELSYKVDCFRKGCPNVTRVPIPIGKQERWSQLPTPPTEENLCITQGCTLESHLTKVHGGSQEGLGTGGLCPTQIPVIYL